MESPQFLSADVTGVGEDEDDWIVTVEWSEPVISCAGSVSQYVLTVTPPTPDCGSEDCVFMTEETQYSLTLTVDQTYNLTVRADTCRNTQRGDDSDPISLTIYGSKQFTTLHEPIFLHCLFTQKCAIHTYVYTCT